MERLSGGCLGVFFPEVVKMATTAVVVVSAAAEAAAATSISLFLVVGYAQDSC